MAAKNQYCVYCGEHVGFFSHSASLDGPVTCGSAECNREEVADRRAELEQRRNRAEDDDYGRYGGNGGW